jgi:hypothetical protein
MTASSSVMRFASTFAWASAAVWGSIARRLASASALEATSSMRLFWTLAIRLASVSAAVLACSSAG